MAKPRRVPDRSILRYARTGTQPRRSKRAGSSAARPLESCLILQFAGVGGAAGAFGAQPVPLRLHREAMAQRRLRRDEHVRKRGERIPLPVVDANLEM